MATSETAIMNRGLNLIGQPAILAPSEDSKLAKTCNRIWPAIRDEVLRAFPWRCVTKRANLTRLEAVPAFGFNYYFQLPTDYLRMVGMSEADAIYETEGDRLLYDDDTAYIKYIYCETDANKYDSLLCTCLAIRLAAELANPIAGSQALADKMMQWYLAFVGLGGSIDSTEAKKQSEDVSWVDER